MKKLVNILNQSQGGQVIVIVLILFALGAVVTGPLVSQVYSLNKLVTTTERNLMGIYAADAGIEYGLWQLFNGSSGNTNYYTTVNGVDVTVTVGPLNSEIDHPELENFTITSTGAGKLLSSTATRVWTNYPEIPAAYQVYRADNNNKERTEKSAVVGWLNVNVTHHWGSIPWESPYIKTRCRILPAEGLGVSPRFIVPQDWGI